MPGDDQQRIVLERLKIGLGQLVHRDQNRFRPEGTAGAAAALALAGAYRWGAGDARDAQIRAALEAALEAKESWDRTDAETLDLSDVDLCLELGGLREDCELLARKAAPRD